MRRGIVVGVGIVVVASCSFLFSAAARGAPLAVRSVLEGREAGTQRPVVALVGKGLAALKRVELLRGGGELVGDAGITLKSSAIVALALPPQLGAADAGEFTLRLYYGRQTQDLAVSLGFGSPLPGTLAASAISIDLAADLADAETLAGYAPAHFLNVSNFDAGTLGTDRFSAFGDLIAESKIGTGPTQVAAGDHDHNTVYPLRTDLTSSGSVNQSGNPVDWSRLKGVPAGFADGVDDDLPIVSTATTSTSHYQTISAPALITGRTLTFNKQSGTTLLRLGYTDMFGLNVAGTGQAGATVRLLIDGQDSGVETGTYRIGFAGELYVPIAARGIVSGIPAGSHTITVQVIPQITPLTFLAGAYTAKAFLEVDEL